MSKRLTKKDVHPGEDPLKGAQHRVALMRKELGVDQPLAPDYGYGLGHSSSAGSIEERSAVLDNTLEYLSATPQEVRQARAAQHIAALIRRPLVRENKAEPVAVYVCDHLAGRAACSKMIEVMPDGSQVRSRRSVAISTLEPGAFNLIVTQCDTHGELAFPKTDEVVSVFGLDKSEADLQLQPA